MDKVPFGVFWYCITSGRVKKTNYRIPSTLKFIVISTHSPLFNHLNFQISEIATSSKQKLSTTIGGKGTFAFQQNNTRSNRSSPKTSDSPPFSSHTNPFFCRPANIAVHFETQSSEVNRLADKNTRRRLIEKIRAVPIWPSAVFLRLKGQSKERNCRDSP